MNDGKRARLRSNSPEAVAQVLAALLTEDGLLSAQEMDFMDRLGVYGIVGVTRETLMRAVAGQVAGRNPSGRAQLESEPTRAARLDAALDAIDNRDQQLVVCAVLLYLAEADRGICDEERSLVRHVFTRWNVSAAELERELNVPSHRTNALYDGARSQGQPS